MRQCCTKADFANTQIISPNHLLAAVFRAANDYLRARLKSRNNVHSEIVFALNPNNNVSTFSLVKRASPVISARLALLKRAKDPVTNQVFDRLDQV